jgi:hypothetical protein
VKTKPRPHHLTMTGDGESLLSSAGASLLVDTARLASLDHALSRELARWRSPWAIHDPGKIILDLATAVALGGDCLADIGVVRAQPELFGLVASDPTVSRLITRLAQDAPTSLAALRNARAAARAQVWATASPVPEQGHIIVDLDATIVASHSEKEGATPRPGNGPSGSTRCWRSSTTARAGPGSTSAASCASARPPPTTPPPTSPS